MTRPPWLYRLLPYLGRRQAEEDLHDELRLHAALERERQRDAGATEAEARRAAQLKLGNVTLIQEETRAVWGWRWIDDLGRDLRHAARGLRRSPGVAATIIIVLAMGIGANTAMFSIVHGMLLRELPYPDADAIVRIGESYGGDAGWSPESLRTARCSRCRKKPSRSNNLPPTGRRVPWCGRVRRGSVTLRGARVSPALFPLLRAAPHVGRLVHGGRSACGRGPGRAPELRRLEHPFRVGPRYRRRGARARTADRSPWSACSPKGFFFPSPDVEVWTPFVIPPFEIRESPDGRGFRILSFLADRRRTTPSWCIRRAGRHRGALDPAAARRRNLRGSRTGGTRSAIRSRIGT